MHPLCSWNLFTRQTGQSHGYNTRKMAYFSSSVQALILAFRFQVKHDVTGSCHANCDGIFPFGQIWYMPWLREKDELQSTHESKKCVMVLMVELKSAVRWTMRHSSHTLSCEKLYRFSLNLVYFSAWRLGTNTFWSWIGITILLGFFLEVHPPRAMVDSVSLLKS